MKRSKHWEKVKDPDKHIRRQKARKTEAQRKRK